MILDPKAAGQGKAIANKTDQGARWVRNVAVKTSGNNSASAMQKHEISEAQSGRGTLVTAIEVHARRSDNSERLGC